MNIAAPSSLDTVLTTLSDTYTLDRRVSGGDDRYAGGGLEYDKDAATADLYLYRPSSSHEIVEVGEQYQGVLSGICLPNEDIEVHDRLSYGDGRYEVMDPIEEQPTVETTEFLTFSLDRVSQPMPELVE